MHVEKPLLRQVIRIDGVRGHRFHGTGDLLGVDVSPVVHLVQVVARVALAVSEVRLADHRGVIAGIPYIAYVTRPVPQFRVGERPHAVFVYRLAGDQARTRGHADRRTRTASRKDNALGGQAVGNRRAGHGITGKAEGVRALLIGEDQNDIGFGVHGCSVLERTRDAQLPVLVAPGGTASAPPASRRTAALVRCRARRETAKDAQVACEHRPSGKSST